jgi:hypothetical protein
MRYLHTQPNGKVTVTVFYAKHLIERDLRKALTDEEHIAFCLRRTQEENPNDTNFTPLPDDYILPDEEFRDAWIQKGAAIDHDLEKAREIQLARIRKARTSKFVELDIAYQRADESSNVVEKQLIASKKQALRNITEPLKSMQLTSIDDVKNAFPAELKTGD